MIKERRKALPNGTILIVVDNCQVFRRITNNRTLYWKRFVYLLVFLKGKVLYRFNLARMFARIILIGKDSLTLAEYEFINYWFKM